jgi:hypothetical protein
MTYRRRSAGSAAARGYGYTHFKLRAAWAPHVQAGEVQCHAKICLEERDGRDRWIEPDKPGEPTGWHLGHDETRAYWTGPEHARCSLSDGAVRGNKMRKRAQHSRAW